MATKKKITQKEISENIHTYTGSINSAWGKGKQFIFPYNWQNDKHCFQFLFYAYGKKKNVVKTLANIINNESDEVIEKLGFVKPDSKVPLSCPSAHGLNCF